MFHEEVRRHMVTSGEWAQVCVLMSKHSLGLNHGPDENSHGEVEFGVGYIQGNSK